MTTTRESKRILSITIKRIPDYDADTREIGEYSDTPNDYAIVNENASREYGRQFVRDLGCECGHSEAQHSETEDYAIGEGGIKCVVLDTAYPCDCDYFTQIHIERGREYRFYNPPIENYEGESDEDMRKYCRQDYERMSAYNRNEWGYVGVKASAEVQLGGSLVQTIRSGGLWGIESDSGEYFAEVEGEQLDELKAQLHAIGFSKRAVTAAMRNVQRKDY